MIGRDLTRLRQVRDELRRIGRTLSNQAYEHPRISLPIGEAVRHVAQAEAFVADAVDTAEAELYHGPLTKE